RTIRGPKHAILLIAMQPDQPTPSTSTPPAQGPDQPRQPLTAEEFASLYTPVAPRHAPGKTNTFITHIAPIALVALVGVATLGVGTFAVMNYMPGGFGMSFAPAVGATVDEQDAKKLFMTAVERHFSTKYIE